MATSATTTLAPFFTNRRAAAAPWPLAAPVMIATLPLSTLTASECQPSESITYRDPIGTRGRQGDVLRITDKGGSGVGVGDNSFINEIAHVDLCGAVLHVVAEKEGS